MSEPALLPSDRSAFLIAVLVHGALIAALSVGIATRQEMRPPAERMTVQLTDEVALRSTAPDPVDSAPASEAPQIGDALPPPADAAEPALAPQPVPPPPSPVPPAPAPRVERPPETRATPRPAAKPAPKPTAKPAPAPRAEAAKPAPSKPAPAAKPAPATKPAAAKPPAAKPAAAAASARPSPRPGGSRLGADFLEGVGDKPRVEPASGTPASVAGPAVQASLKREVYRLLKPHWTAPTGADAELLRTQLSIRLNCNGTLAGTPRVLRTTGETASNRNQVQLHQERAVRAAQLANWSALPEEYCDAWKLLEPITFYTGGVG